MKRVHLNSLFGVVKDLGEDVFETQHVLDRRLASFRSLPDWLSLPSIVIVIGKFGRLHAHVIGNSVLGFFVVFFLKGIVSVDYLIYRQPIAIHSTIALVRNVPR